MIRTATDKDKILQSSSKCTMGRLSIHPKLLPGFEAAGASKSPKEASAALGLAPSIGLSQRARRSRTFALNTHRNHLKSRL